MGFVGFLKASSAGSTTDCVTMATTGRARPRRVEFVGERLDEHVADGALRVGHGVVHGHRVHLGLGQFRPAQDEADLRAVAVRDDEPPALLDQIDEMRDGTADGLVLLGDGVVLGVGDERVAAERDDRGLAQAAPPVTVRNASSPAASAAMESLKHSIGAVVMPAPI